MKPKIVSKTFGWIIVVLVILGIFVYFFSNSNSKVVVDPNIITITEVCAVLFLESIALALTVFAPLNSFTFVV